MDGERRTGAQLLIEGLLAHGVDTVFGIPGVHSMELFDAMYDHQNDIRFISTRHEHAAALMADGYARASGKPGVLFTTTGPGAANSMGGLGEAFHSSSSVLHVTTTAAENLYGRGLGTGHETRDQLGMFAGVTRWRTHVGDPGAVHDAVQTAFHRFSSGRPGPIVIEVASDVLAGTSKATTPAAANPPVPARPDAATVRRIARLLSKGRVAIWTGGGISRADASPALVELAEALDAPVCTTAMGKDGFPDDHRLSLGLFDRGGEGSALPAFEAAPDPLPPFVAGLDALLVVGSSLAYSRTRGQGLVLPAGLVHVDIDPEVPGRNYPPREALVADAARAARAILDGVRAENVERPTGWSEEIDRLRRERAVHLRVRHPGATETMALLRRIAPRDAIFVVDPTVPVFHGAHPCLPIFVPRSYFVPRWSGIGFAFAASAGAKVAKPERKVICLIGDGGFQFNIQELATCVEHGIAPVVVVFNDAGWGILRQRQRSRYGGRLLGTDLAGPDFVQLAEAYGALGLRVTSRAELGDALGTALESTRVAVLDVSLPNGWESFR